jgi:hypothetical protein
VQLGGKSLMDDLLVDDLLVDDLLVDACMLILFLPTKQ